MEVAPCYTLLTLFTLFALFALFTLFNTVYNIQIALPCLNSSIYVCILLGKVRTLWEWADGLLSKMLGDGVYGWMGPLRSID